MAFHALPESPMPDAPPEFPAAYSSVRAAAFGGMRDAIAAPSLVLGASYVGFGSLIRESGLGLGWGMASTFGAWALPGQIVALEMVMVGGSLAALFLAVAATNFRLLPMTVSLVPHLRAPARPAWVYYLAAHLIAVTGWAMGMLRCPSLPPEQRLPYFAAASGTLWIASLAGTALGFLAAGSVPHVVSLALLFLNPLYFLLVFLGDLRQRWRPIALAIGFVMGPLMHLAEPSWGLVITGLVGGSAAFLLDRSLTALRGGR